MPRKLIVSGLALVAAASVVGGATYAKFSDTEVAAAQSIKAGTLDLTIDGSAQSAPINLTNVKPGDQSYGVWTQATGNQASIPAGQPDQIIHLVNNGSVDGKVTAYIVKDSDTENGCNTPEAAVDTTCANPGDGQGELDSTMSLMLGGFTVSNFGSQGLGEANKVALGTYDLAAHAEDWKRIVWQIPASAGNEIQSDGVGFHFEFVLEQA